MTTPEQEFNAAINAASNDAAVVDACYAFIALASTWNLAGVLAGTFS